MARDYKNRTQAARRKPQPRPGRPPWMWGLGGFALGLVVAMGAYVEGRYPGTFVTVTDDDLAALPDDGPPVVTPPESTPPRAKPRFEFYTLLPEAEVEVTDEPAPRRKPPAPRVAQPEADKPLVGAGEAVAAGLDAETEAGVKSYMLQVGSFRALSDADRLRASLTLSGHDALIQTVSKGGDETWHRVRLGPFGDLSAANRARAALARDQVEAMVLRIRS